MFYLGLDIGGTKIAATVLRIEKAPFTDSLPLYGATTLHWRTLCLEQIPTERVQGYEHSLDNSVTICQRALHMSGVGSDQLEAIGIGLPGSVHPMTRRMIAGNSGIFTGRDMGGDLQKHLGWEGLVVCGNDANCFTLAEIALASTDDKPESAIGLILGTGVGAGFYCQGQIYAGRLGAATELGHTELVTHGHPCYCGLSGCVEGYLSGPALEAAYASRMYSHIEHRPTAAKIFTLAAEHEPIALAVVTQYKKHLVKFMVQITQIFDPELIVLGGGVSIQSSLYEGLREEIARYTFTRSAPQIRKHQLGPAAGVYGAALLAHQGVA